MPPRASPARLATPCVAPLLCPHPSPALLPLATHLLPMQAPPCSSSCASTTPTRSCSSTSSSLPLKQSKRSTPRYSPPPPLPPPQPRASATLAAAITLAIAALTASALATSRSATTRTGGHSVDAHRLLRQQTRVRAPRGQEANERGRATRRREHHAAGKLGITPSTAATSRVACVSPPHLHLYHIHICIHIYICITSTSTC